MKDDHSADYHDQIEIDDTIAPPHPTPQPKYYTRGSARQAHNRILDHMVREVEVMPAEPPRYLREAPDASNPQRSCLKQ